jgi:hypothetical protein
MKPGWSAVKLLFFCLLTAVAQLAWAAGEAATVVNLVGTVSAQAPDGKVRILAKDSVLVSGEIVMTEKGSVVRLAFSDGGQTTLRPSSRLVIEAYHYVPATPEQDSAVLNLVKGGMRVLSGAIGKRGNQDAYLARTKAGTIGIRGTDYALMICEKGGETCDQFNLPQNLRSAGHPASGLYFVVYEGAIWFANHASQDLIPAVTAGYVQDIDTHWVALPNGDPGLDSILPEGMALLFGSGQGVCKVR